MADDLSKLPRGDQRSRADPALDLIAILCKSRQYGPLQQVSAATRKTNGQCWLAVPPNLVNKREWRKMDTFWGWNILRSVGRKLYRATLPRKYNGLQDSAFITRKNNPFSCRHLQEFSESRETRAYIPVQLVLLYLGVSGIARDKSPKSQKGETHMTRPKGAQTPQSVRSHARFILAGMLLTVFLSSVRAQPSADITIASGAAVVGSSTFQDDDYSLINPCYENPYNSCMVVVAFNESAASDWYYNTDGSNNGIGDLAIFFYVNYVYDATYYTNTATNPGAITVVGVTGTDYTFQGTEAKGSCTNDAYYQQGVTPAYYTWNDGEIYTLGIPFTCN
jgi:hypothetical protein